MNHFERLHCAILTIFKGCVFLNTVRMAFEPAPLRLKVGLRWQVDAEVDVEGGVEVEDGAEVD